MSAYIALSGWVVVVATLVVTRMQRAQLLEHVARAAHELRGPLAAARLGLELARRPGRDPAPVLRSVDLQMARAALALEDLGTQRRSPASVEPVDVRALIADCVEAHVGVAVRRGVALRLEPDLAHAVWVDGDRTRLAQAISNLVSNAIEHGCSEHGGAVEVALRDGPPGSVRVEVSDSGPGLPARVDEIVRRPRAGRGRRGRGLAIAAGIASAHGGRLLAAPAARGARLVLELRTRA